MSYHRLLVFGVRFVFCYFVVFGSIVVTLVHSTTTTENDDTDSTDNIELWGQHSPEREYSQSRLDILNYGTKKRKMTKHRCESTLLIFRHCEKHGALVKDEDKNWHCSYIGRERSHYIATLFGVNGTDPTTTMMTSNANSSSSSNTTIATPPPPPRWSIPYQLFSYTDARTKRLNFREIETITPLSLKFDIPIQVYDNPTSVAEDYFQQLQNGQLCNERHQPNKITVVSWKHEYLTDLALSLGCSKKRGCPKKYPHDSFDPIWQINHKYDHFRGKWKVRGYVTSQNFDPLKFSTSAGDYPKNGTSVGGRWIDDH